MDSQNDRPQTNSENQPKPPTESNLLATFNFFVTYRHESSNNGGSRTYSESELLERVSGSITRDFTEGVKLLYQGQVGVKIERLTHGSILGTVVLVVTSGIAAYQFIAQYKDFNESLGLLGQQLQSILGNEVKRAGLGEHTVNVIVTPSPALAKSVAIKEEDQPNLAKINKDTLRAMAEDAITSTLLFKLATWLLPWYLLVGLIIWGGGVIYGGVQIASLKDQSYAIQEESRQIERQLQEAEAKINNIIDSLTEDVQLASENAIITIEAETQKTQTRAADIEQVAQEAQRKIDEERVQASEEIQAERARAIQLLNVDSLPDLRQLEQQFDTIEAARGRLDSITYAQFVDEYSIELGLILAGSFIFSLLALISSFIFR